MKRMLLICVVAGLAWPVQVSAWGMLGHRITGGIAEHYLTPRAKAEIKKLLGTESLAMAGNWADFIKSDRSYDYLGPWHYVNIKAGLSRHDVVKWLNEDTGANLYNRIIYLARELKSGKLGQNDRVFYLKLLIHLVADAHQPMHMGQSGDRGGNNIKLYWFGEPTNLHRIWDEQLIEFQQLSYTEHVAAINFVSTADKNTWMKQQPSEWIYESYVIAQKLYTEVKPEEKLLYNYNFNHVNIMNQQLLKGGVRLAAMLNNVFGG